MYVVMGASGHVGSAVADELLEQREQVTVVLHDARKADGWLAKGAQVVEANVDEVDSLKKAFGRGRRAFVLNPPADTKLDTDEVERRTVARILAGLEGAHLEKVVAASTMGAQAGTRIGDFSVLWELEQGLARQSVPAAIDRAAYYFSNWDPLLDVVRRTGQLPTLFPVDFAMPMVAPADLGKVAAARLRSSTADVGMRHVEGPRRYTSADVAKAFAASLGRPVEPVVTPRSQWKESFLKLGFSDAAASAYARMTAVTVDNGFEPSDATLRGSTTLEDYIERLVARG